MNLKLLRDVVEEKVDLRAYVRRRRCSENSSGFRWIHGLRWGVARPI